MCGLIGVSRATRTSIPDGRLLMRVGLLSIESRGRHATGIGYATRDDTDTVWYSTRKGPASKQARRLSMPKGMHTAIGHTRHATIGSSDDPANRHPVVNEHIVATHNGQVWNADELIKLAGVERVGEVDSFAIPALLSRQEELSADHATELLELIEGVAAIAWMDATENEVLHLARLSTRPLHLGWTKRGDLLYASTAEALRRTGRLAGVAVHDVASVPEGTYFRVERGEVTDSRSFEVRHPVRSVAEDMPTPARSSGRKLAPVPEPDDLDWWEEFDRAEAERYAEQAAIFDQALVPRRGWK